jgi:hypothetical protein
MESARRIVAGPLSGSKTDSPFSVNCWQSRTTGQTFASMGSLELLVRADAPALVLTMFAESC